MLLYALQRLKLDQWDLNPSLDERVRRAHLGTFDRNYAGDIVEPSPMPVTIGGKEFGLTDEIYHATLGIIGRGTVTCGAKFEDGLTYAVKISWPEESRPSEAKIIQAAMKKAQGDTDITNHIPRVFAMQDFPYHTGTARRVVGIPERKEGHPNPRVLRVIVFPSLRPITAFKERFIPSWLACVRCVYCQTWLMCTRL